MGIELVEGRDLLVHDNVVDVIADPARLRELDLAVLKE
jgi:uncharacterized circularly permuted ATP-grasp superfamily protein